MSAYVRIPLQAGDRIRLTEGGQVRIVQRVNLCAAYVSGEPKIEMIVEPEFRKVKEVDPKGVTRA